MFLSFPCPKKNVYALMRPSIRTNKSKTVALKSGCTKNQSRGVYTNVNLLINILVWQMSSCKLEVCSCYSKQVATHTIPYHLEKNKLGSCKCPYAHREQTCTREEKETLKWLAVRVATQILVVPGTVRTIEKTAAAFGLLLTVQL